MTFYFSVQPKQGEHNAAHYRIAMLCNPPLYQTVVRYNGDPIKLLGS